MTERRFYFEIRSANVIECIWASSLTDAKAKATADWMPWWSEIEWLNPEQSHDVFQPDGATVP
jgi:hypothetical protein